MKDEKVTTEIPFWHNTEIVNLTITVIDDKENSGMVYLSLDTNGVNIISKKIDCKERSKMIAIDNIWQVVKDIQEQFYEGEKTENYDEFKKKSMELIEKTKLL